MGTADRIGIGIPAVALVAGVLSGALLRSPVSPESQKRPVPSANADKTLPAAGTSHVSPLADLRPVMELLGEALGTSVARDDVIRAARALRPNVKASDRLILRALDSLQKEIDSRALDDQPATSLGWITANTFALGAGW